MLCARDRRPQLQLFCNSCIDDKCVHGQLRSFADVSSKFCK